MGNFFGGSSGGVSPVDMATAIDAIDHFESVAPTAGSTVALSGSYRIRTLNLNHPANIVGAVAVTLPSDADSQNGDEVEVVLEKGVTLFTVNGPATILNPLVATPVIANDRYKFKRLSAGKWIR